jgi:hypothetical protein
MHDNRPERMDTMSGNRNLTDSSPCDVGALAGLVTGVSFLAGFGGAMALAKNPFPRPGASTEEIRKHFGGSARAARFSATGQLISTIALARFTASVARLAARSLPGSPALRAAAIAGGGLAVASLTTAPVTQAMLTGPNKDDDSAVAMSRRVFVAGGPVHGIDELDDRLGAFVTALEVLRVVDGKVAEVTTFGAGMFPLFGLPATL